MKKIIQRTVGMKKEIGRALVVALPLIAITFIGIVALFAGGSHQSTNVRTGSQATGKAVAPDQNVSSSASRSVAHQRVSESSFNLMEGPGPDGETVTTDKSDYEPGETVVISGTGWVPNTAVALHIDDSNGVSRWDASVTADPSGNISNSDFVIQPQDVGLAFTLTATQGTVTAWTQFTDVVGAGTAPNGDPGGFEIDGDLRASATPVPITDWLDTIAGGGGNAGLLFDTGVPKDTTVTYRRLDPANCSPGTFCDDVFSPTSGSINDNPNTKWFWQTDQSNDKTDMNNVYVHISKDGAGHRWVTASADRYKTNGTAYVDFEFLQNTLTRNLQTACIKPPCGNFTSTGPDGGRTVGDILVTANYGNGGGLATILVFQWQAVSGGFAYVDITSTIVSGEAFVATSLVPVPPGVPVPYGAFGTTAYDENQFVEVAIDLTVLIGALNDPCTGIQIKTVMIKTKTSTSTNATLEDQVEPIQVSFAAGFAISAEGTDPACSGGLGTITGTFSGGTAPYQCQLDNGAFSSCTSPVTYNNVGAGPHTITVKDSTLPTACQKTSNSVTITIPSAVTVTSSPSPILCHGGSSTVTVSASGGTAPYSGTGTFTRSAGTYSFSVTDAHSCTGTTTGTITEPSVLTASSSKTVILCHGGNSTVTVSATGGTAPYGGTGTFVHAAGSYSYTVTDANSCTSTTTGTITEPDALVAGSSNTAILCHGGSSTVTVSATGGTSPYLGTGTFAHGAGTYSYTVTDANSCTSTTTGTITEPDTLVAGSSNTAILCHGGSSTVTVSATGGTAPYAGTGTFAHAAGTYSYTVTDANSCTSTTTGTITEPDALVAGSSNTAILCHGGSSTVTVSATGGTSPYSGTGTFAHGAGTYSYTVTDANSCTSTTTGTITEPDALVADSSNTPILCKGGSSTVTVSATGGTSPYSGTGTFTHGAGTYSYTVTDANSCTSTTTGTITEPTGLNASSSNTPILCNGGNSVVTVSATGGTAPYAGTGTFAHGAGTYSYTVTDANSCTSTTTGAITQPTALMASSSNTPILCNGGTSSVTVSASGGTAPYSGTGTFTRSAGTYSYTVTDRNGCTASTTGNITQPDALNASSSFTPILCNGGTSIVTVSATGGTTPYSGTGTFSRSAGTYSFTVRDANSCTATTTGTITQPPAITLSLQVGPCSDTNDGSIMATFGGGTAPYQIKIDAGPYLPATSPYTFTGLAPGSHSVTVKDANGCTKSSSITVASCPHCALTQGAYGNKGGKYTYNGHKYTTTQLLQLLTSNSMGGPITVGVPGRSLTITQGAITCLDGDNSCKLARLPANTAPATLPTSFGDQMLNACGTIPNCQTTPPIPLQGNAQWQNNLLGQTVTLTLNSRIDPTLLNLVLPSCLPIRASVMTALNNASCNGGFGPTIRGLLYLANQALGGQSTCSASVSDINDAIDSINNQFDSDGNTNCRACQ